ncbi:hypothetical protein [Actinocorallia longicatena]|uniref:Uncharacterized protein n=1 Tax=Actinocorallia longicatena TaxID=111803 RepID=A0ABP6QBD1_9ACTN
MRSMWALPLAALALCTLSACGDKGGDDGVASLNKGGATPSASATPSLSEEDARVKFEQCMRDNGAKLQKTPDGKGMAFGGGKGDMKKTEAAMKKCQPILAQGGIAPPDANDPAVRDALVKFAQCMREHGVKMQDPGANGELKIEGPPRGGEGGPGKDPKVETANKECAKLLPNGGGPMTRKEEK